MFNAGDRFCSSMYTYNDAGQIGETTTIIRTASDGQIESEDTYTYEHRTGRLAQTTCVQGMSSTIWSFGFDANGALHEMLMSVDGEPATEVSPSDTT